jgi:glycine/sarcosine N-methyltransferase
MSEITEFYDELSEQYHLIFADWDEAVERQGRVVDRVIRDLAGPGPKRILDAACGIGTQAIGLAQLGHDVTGTDLSSGAVARARREAERLGVSLAAEVADLRNLTESIAGPFDVVCALDNALPHLEGEAELSQALNRIVELLAPGGLFLASVRDYDALLRDRPRVEAPRVIDDPQGHRVVFQVWDWAADGKSYRLHLYFIRYRNGVGAETRVFTGLYWPLTRANLDRLMGEAGLELIKWLEPEEAEFYQPIVAARRP